MLQMGDVELMNIQNDSGSRDPLVAFWAVDLEHGGHDGASVVQRIKNMLSAGIAVAVEEDVDLFRRRAGDSLEAGGIA